VLVTQFPSPASSLAQDVPGRSQCEPGLRNWENRQYLTISAAVPLLVIATDSNHFKSSNPGNGTTSGFISQFRSSHLSAPGPRNGRQLTASITLDLVSGMVEWSRAMTNEPSGFYLSSGRRRRPARSGCLVVSGVLVIIVLIAVFEITRREQPPPVAPSPTPLPAATSTPTPTRTLTPTFEQLSAEAVVEAPTLTPTPWRPPPVAPPARRPSTPTPSAAACISASWDAQQSLAAWGNVLVNITATNRCRRVLQPTDVWFQVTGYRNGDMIQTARGSPFREIYPGRTTQFGIGLPGSIDWYDEITVEVFD
jgi:hypothetical protein